MVMRKFCSPRAHELDVQHLHHGPLLSVIPVPGDMTPLLASEGTLHTGTQAHMQVKHLRA